VSQPRDSDDETPAPPQLFAPARLGPIELRNRVVKAATNEGLARGSLVAPRLIDWHRRFAAGGVGMTTLAYCAVAPEGRTFRDQIWLREQARPGLRRFVAAMHAEGARVAIQLGHAGWFAPRRVIGARPLGPSRQWSPHGMSFSRAMRKRDLASVREQFATATRLSVETGFDAIEVHLGHGYLLSQFLCPWHNQRDDAYGGDLKSRARFPREVLRAVREAAGDDVAVYAKLNMLDGFRGGLTLDEGIEVAHWLEEDQSVHALQLTGGHTTRTPMFLMRGDVPLQEMIENEPDWLRRQGLRWLGPRVLESYPFEEAFFLESALQVREAIGLPLMLLGGVTRLESMQRAVAEGFSFVALGRALLREPDLVARLEQGELQGSSCDHCNKCMAEMERPSGTRCVYWTEEEWPSTP
jgi:2,4-dienoyl-CoA reductase-like NADH-dependent reductase (Old Yellow Enzyme family)